MEKILLDTNVIVELLKNNEDLADHEATFYTSSINLFEIEQWLKQLTTDEIKEKWKFLSRKLKVLGFTEKSSEIFYKLKEDLKSEDFIKHDKDLQIAAICIENGLKLVSRDGFFRKIADLKLESKI
jgi:predicted nucleic acid-binding protein